MPAASRPRGGVRFCFLLRAWHLVCEKDDWIRETGSQTYKAVDVNLRCAVALKVINARFIGDESARRRFVREARSAASVRHPNVASVFHLGKSGETYFYAMEFVEGETLDSLIDRCGRLEVNLALEVATQVTAGLAAVHKQKLVHRDIKPANIMVKPEEGGGINAKIIDLGLAKAVEESQSETAISVRGSFAGTPEFASPEQFAGVGADIRSDLYSLGVVLWEMLTGKVPFNGSAAEVMYQHLHTPSPVERLRGVPQPVVVLLGMLLEKDPACRFQNPTELLKATATVTRAIKARRTIKHQQLRATFVRRSSTRQKDSPAIRVPKRSIAVLPFDALSHSRRDTYFADGVQDEILSNLARVSRLKVISRTSVMTYRPGANRDLRSIADALGVANVVEGTVRRDGNRIRLTSKLINARTDEIVWSETYDRDLTDIFAIQSEIAKTVASRLSAQLSSEERKDIEEKPTNNLEAYDLYLQAKQLLGPNTVVIILWRIEKETYSRAISLLEEATQKDRNFALAYCMIAKAHDYLYSDQVDRTPERRALGDAAVNEALRLRPDLAEVHLAAAFHLYICYRDFERARVQIAIAAQALAMCTRDFAAAGEIVSKSPNEEIRFFGPLVPRRIVALWLELVQGNHPTMEEFGAAREQLYRKVEADRTDPFMLAALALADVALGHKEESIQKARRAMEMRPISNDAEDGPCIAANVAVVYAWANQSDFAFEQLNILIKRTSYVLVTYGNLKTNPTWDPLRKDPRFDKLLAELAPKD